MHATKEPKVPKFNIKDHIYHQVALYYYHNVIQLDQHSNIIYMPI